MNTTKKPFDFLLAMALAMFLCLPAGNALAENPTPAAMQPSDGAIKVALPERWSVRKTGGNPPFWWVDFADSRRDADVFVSMERKIGFGYRYPRLEDWGTDFIARILKRYTEGAAYETREVVKVASTLGSGQAVEFSTHQLVINGHNRSVSFAVFSSKDDARRVLVEIYQKAAFGDVSEHIPSVAKGISLSD